MKSFQLYFKEAGDLNGLIGAMRSFAWNLNIDISSKDDRSAQLRYAEIKSLLKEINIKVGELDRKLEDDI